LVAPHAELVCNDANEFFGPNDLRTRQVVDGVIEHGGCPALDETVDDVGDVGGMVPVIAPPDET
jgi:hypothetical protein